MKRREIPVGWGYIRGYAAPQYEEIDENITMDENNDKDIELDISGEGVQNDIYGTKTDDMTGNKSTVPQKRVLSSELNNASEIKSV